MGSGALRAQVAVFGLGYVGCVTAACLARVGHRVTGIDPDGKKVQDVLEGRAPFYEPGLDALVREYAAAGSLTATGDARRALLEADVALVCVGTPSERNGNLGLEQLRRVVEEIAGGITERKTPLIVAIRSTVFPGTCEEVVAPVLGSGAYVVSNPEFLREGVAIRDFIEPSLIVVGGSNSEAVRRVAALYDGLGVEPCLVSLRTAEMIKYACNAFHALKIAFANEIGALSAKLEVNGAEVMDTLCRDVKLNLSPAYLKPGFPFGGSCLPKDLRALVYRASRLDLELPLLESVLPSNSEHLKRALEAVAVLPARRLGFVGLAFKENTDDLRESPVVSMIEHLIGKGRDLRVWDPHISLESIYGSNRNYLLNAIPHIGRLLDCNLTDLLGWADHLVLTNRPPAPVAEQIRNAGKPVLDLAGTFQPEAQVVGT